VLQISTQFQKVAVCKSVGLHFHVDMDVRVSAMSATENMKMCGVMSSVKGEESASCMKITVYVGIGEAERTQPMCMWD
jgi:hypothetical protein